MVVPSVTSAGMHAKSKNSQIFIGASTQIAASGSKPRACPKRTSEILPVDLLTVLYAALQRPGCSAGDAEPGSALLLMPPIKGRQDM
jgi:hypothetical protein